MVTKVKKIKLGKVNAASKKPGKSILQKEKKRVKNIKPSRKQKSKVKEIKSRNLNKAAVIKTAKRPVKKPVAKPPAKVPARVNTRVKRKGIQTKARTAVNKAKVQAKAVRRRSVSKIKGSVKQKGRPTLNLTELSPAKVTKVSKKRQSKVRVRDKKAVRKIQAPKKVLAPKTRPAIVHKNIQKRSKPKIRPHKVLTSKVAKNAEKPVKKPVTEVPVKVPLKQTKAKVSVKQTEAVEPNPAPSEAMEKAKKQPDRWSECGLIFYTAGKAYGISSNLRTICIGTEPETRAFLDEGKLHNKLNYLQKDALTHIKEIRKIEAVKAVEMANKPADKGQEKKAKGKITRSLVNRKKLAAVSSRFKKWSLSRR